ncbi:hypothetical protein ACFLY0_01090 [Patescibacteria group bacterium]
MKIDLHKERCEEKLPLNDFLKSYNEDLPSQFPHASVSLLNEFKKTHPGLFNNDNTWSLGQHRKKFMDWLPQQKA